MSRQTFPLSKRTADDVRKSIAQVGYRRCGGWSLLAGHHVGDGRMSHSVKSAPSVRFHNVTLGYHQRAAVHHFDGEIATGSLTAIVGPNGGGKSTLLKGIVGQLQPLQGSIAVTGITAGSVAYLPQQAAIDRTFPITVFKLAALGLWNRVGSFGRVSRSDRDRVARAVSAVGLEGFERRSIEALSGGQLQRVLFARVLVQDSPLILLDEPFTAIDTKTSVDLIDLIDRWHSEQRTVVAVLHDTELVKERFPSALLLVRQSIAWGETTSVMTAANLLKARAMSERWEDTAPCARREQHHDPL